MGSLQDVFSEGELYEFDERVKKAVGKAVYCVEPNSQGVPEALNSPYSSVATIPPFHTR